MLVPLFVSVRIERTGFSALQDVLRLAPPTSNDLQAIALPARDGYRTILEPALRMDEAIGLTSFGMLSVQPLPEPIYYLEGGKRDPALGWILGSPFYRVFLLAEDLANYRRNMYQAEELCKQPYFEAMSKMRAVDEDRRATHGGGVIARFTTLDLQHVSSIIAQGEAYHRLSRLGLAARAYELKYGSAPSSIDSLTPEFQPRTPLDPFDGKPMRMKTGKGELLFYSVSYNCKDDGGDAERDIVFRLKVK